MLDNGDEDIDINLLSELLDNAENDDKNGAPEANAKVIRNRPETFDSILEDLDRIPIKAPSRKKLSDKTSLFNNHETKSKVSNGVKSNGSAVHTGDTDSSDDEEARKLGSVVEDFGSSVKRMLKTEEEEKRGGPRLLDVKSLYNRQPTWKKSALSVASGSANSLGLAPKKKTGPVDVYTDPSIGIRMINPLVSSSVMKDRLVGRRVVPMSQVKHFTSDGKVTDDWVIFGVIVSKAPPRTSAKGSSYSIIKLSDLRGPGNPKTVSLFLFSSAFKKHGKDSVGTVIGILNPGIMDNSRSHGDEACLSVDNGDRVMILGTSKDFGLCKSKKKNGENCTSIVNTALCEYCVYHVKQEYMKCSKRSDIQSSFNGPGLSNLRNKVLGKNEVFYGGQSFSAVPAKKSKKLMDKDQSRLSVLSGVSSSTPMLGLKPAVKKGLACSVELSHRQTKKDIDRLQKLIMVDSKCLSEPSSSSVVTAQFNSEKVKPDDAKHAALALIAQKKKSLEETSHTLVANEESESSKIKSVCEEKSLPSTVAKDAEVMSENVSCSRGVMATLALAKKKQSTGDFTPSSLGLGRSSHSEEAAGCNKVNKPASISSPKQVASSSKASKEMCQSDSSGKIPAKSDLKKAVSSKPANPSLSSDQLKKLANSGMDFESRMLKQAAQQVAMKEEASKLNPHATPSMLGLGKTSALARMKTGSLNGLPKLGSGLSPSSTIDLSAPICKRGSIAAKFNAINLIKRKGGISKTDPNNRDFESRKKASKESKPNQGVKRLREETAGSAEEEKDIEARRKKFKDLMEATSSHTDLIDAAENEAQEEYFGKLEKKEQMEEKMLNTFKVACKAVRCLTCKYTSFSASEMCKTERHPLRVMDAMKRFFKCGDCSNRTVTLEVIPLVSCSNCGSSRWERAGMIRERKVGVSKEILSVRGMEETFIGSVTTGANVNLLVPEDGT